MYAAVVNIMKVRSQEDIYREKRNPLTWACMRREETSSRFILCRPLFDTLRDDR